MEADEARRMDAAAALEGLEGALEGLRLGQAIPLDAASEAELDRRALGQAELHMTWRRLQRRRAHEKP
jgi:hypothetical protein